MLTKVSERETVSQSLSGTYIISCGVYSRTQSSCWHNNSFVAVLGLTTCVCVCVCMCACVCVCVYEVEKALEKYSVKQREREREGGRKCKMKRERHC